MSAEPAGRVLIASNRGPVSFSLGDDGRRRLREPAPDGYHDTQDFGPAERLVPVVAPDAFAVRLDELELS